MIAENFSYTISETGNWQTIVLTKISTGETKEFRSVAKSMIGLTNHMESMSDESCDGFFPKPKKDKK